MKTNYTIMWNILSKKDNWRKYILPKRDDKKFWEEGKYQADKINKYIPDDAIVLEFGCGIGRILKFIKAKRKIGVDVCQAFLDKIDSEDITKICSDGVFIPVKEGSIDFIYSIFVFQHIKKEDHNSILIELFNKLKKGGTILIQFPGRSDYYKQTRFMNIYDEEEIKKFCRKAGIDNYSIINEDIVLYGDIVKEGEAKEYFLLIKK